MKAAAYIRMLETIHLGQATEITNIHCLQMAIFHCESILQFVCNNYRMDNLRERERKRAQMRRFIKCIRLLWAQSILRRFCFQPKIRKLVRVLKNGPKYVISHFRMNSNQLIKRPWMHGIRKPILKLRDVYVCPHCSHAAQLRPTDRTER